MSLDNHIPFPQAARDLAALVADRATGLWFFAGEHKQTGHVVLDRGEICNAELQGRYGPDVLRKIRGLRIGRTWFSPYRSVTFVRRPAAFPATAQVLHTLGIDAVRAPTAQIVSDKPQPIASVRVPPSPAPAPSPPQPHGRVASREDDVAEELLGAFRDPINWEALCETGLHIAVTLEAQATTTGAAGQPEPPEGLAGNDKWQELVALLTPLAESYLGDAARTICEEYILSVRPSDMAAMEFAIQAMSAEIGEPKAAAEFRSRAIRQVKTV